MPASYKMSTSYYLTNTALAAVGFLISKLVTKYISYRFSPLWKLPGPKNYYFFFGNTLHTERLPFYQEHIKWVEAAGPEADMIHYTGFLGGHTILVTNCDYLKKILMSPVSKLATLKYARRNKVLEKVLGNGLVGLQGEDWKRHRKLLHPAFSVNFLKEQLSQVVPSKTKELIKCWKSCEGRELDIGAHLSMLSLDVIGQVGFSHDFNGMKSVQEWTKGTDNKFPALQDKIIGSMESLFSNNIIFRMFLYAVGLDALDFEGNKVQAIMDKAVDKVVTNARTQLMENETRAKENGEDYTAKSVIQLMLEAQKGESGALTDAELRDEVKTFIVAGHETTSAFVYWALYVLSKHADIQEKVYQNIQKHCPSSGEMTLDDIEKMDYFDAFLKESSRLYPPIGTILRHTLQDDSFKDISIPKGTRINIPIFILHRSEKYWDKPLECLPERWMDPDNKPPHSHPQAYMPFSYGPHNCIGYRFAILEAKLILSALIREMKFQLTPELRNVELKLKTRLSVRSVPDVKLLAQSR